MHDRYGRVSGGIDPDAAVVEVRPGLLELPMSRVAIGPLTAPRSGGGYFRLPPYGLYRRGVARRLRTRAWFMFYLHPWELDPGERVPSGMPRILRFRAFGREHMRKDLQRLLAKFGWQRVVDVLLARGYAPPDGRRP
jgi:Domain of unknown function (DUF3473)